MEAGLWQRWTCLHIFKPTQRGTVNSVARTSKFVVSVSFVHFRLTSFHVRHPLPRRRVTSSRCVAVVHGSSSARRGEILQIDAFQHQQVPLVHEEWTVNVSRVAMANDVNSLLQNDVWARHVCS